MKELLDGLVKKYETKDFIKNDPIQFPHRYFLKKDIEISGFISSLFAFGKRNLFIKKLDELFNLASSPYSLILDYKKYNLERAFIIDDERSFILSLCKIPNITILESKYSDNLLTIKEKEKYKGNYVIINKII